MKDYKLVIIICIFAIFALVSFRVAIFANEKKNGYQMPEDYMAYYMVLDDIEDGAEILEKTDTIDLYIKSDMDSNTVFASPLLENLVVRKALTEDGDYTEDPKEAYYVEIHVPKDVYTVLQSVDIISTLSYEIAEVRGEDENFTINLKLQDYIRENYTVMDTDF